MKLFLCILCLLTLAIVGLADDYEKLKKDSNTFLKKTQAKAFLNVEKRGWFWRRRRNDNRAAERSRESRERTRENQKRQLNA